MRRRSAPLCKPAPAGGQDGVPDPHGRSQQAEGGTEAAEGPRIEGAETDLDAPGAQEVGGQGLDALDGVHGGRVDAYAGQAVLQGLSQRDGHGLAAQGGQGEGVPQDAGTGGRVHAAQTEGDRRGGAGSGGIHGELPGCHRQRGVPG